MKLLICASEYYPYGSGIANVAYNVVEEFKKLGIECVICSPTGPDIKIKSPEKYGRVGHLYFWYKVNKFFSRQGDEYDFVWLHNPLFLTKVPFSKCLVTIHSIQEGKTHEKDFPLHLRLYYLIASAIDNICLNKLKKSTNVRFTAVGWGVFQGLNQIGINKTQIAHIPNGVNLSKFKPHNQVSNNKFKFSKRDIVILSVGRLNEIKQPLKLVNLFAQMSIKMNNLTLVIAGSGELHDQVQKLVKMENLNNVKILGHVDYEELPDLYACSDYYIITSRYEGQPLTLLEAMASGLKCIVSDIPNLKIIIENANCGISIDLDDIEDATKDLVEYIRSDNDIHSINAREYAKINFDWNKIAIKYLEEFNKLNVSSDTN